MKKIEKSAELIERKSMTKKEYEAKQKAQRNLNPINTGTRPHKSKKDYDRKKFKKVLDTND